MTVATTQISEVWTGDASSVTFPIPFPFLDRAHLIVWKEDSLGAQTAMVISSATGEGEASGGSITMTAPVGVGYTFHVRRNTPKTQETDYVPHDPFPADSHERALDKLTMIVQELIASGSIDIDIDHLGDLIGDSPTIIWTRSPDGTKLIGTVQPGAGDTYKVKVNADDAAPGFLAEKLVDSDDVHWNALPDDSGIQAVVQEGAGDTYKVKVNADDAAPGFLEEKIADTTDTQFSPTEDGSQLDSIVYQLTGLGTRLNRVKDAGFDFEVGPFPQANYAGGRGICFGRRFVAGVEVDTWITQANNGKLYWTSNNDASRWKVATEDLSLYTTFPNDRVYYGWSCIQFVYVAGTHNCYCWVMGSGDHERHIKFVEHKAANYNADGTFKASALDGVTYPIGTGPYSAIDIMQVDTSGGIFIAGDDAHVGYTTDLVTFQYALTADHNVGGLGFDGETTVHVVERDTGVIWRSTAYGAPGTFAKVATFYLDDVPVSNFPIAQGGTFAQWGSMFSMYGQWLSINFHYVAGGIGFIYSDDGIYWYSSRDAATPFYDANNDGLRWFATNAVPNSGTPIFQLIISMIPAHRRMSLEKGAVVSGPLIMRELPNVSVLGTDHRGRMIPVAYDLALSDLSDVDVSSPTDGQVLSWDGTKWVNASESGGASEYDAVCTTEAELVAALTSTTVQSIYVRIPSGGEFALGSGTASLTVGATKRIYGEALYLGTIAIDPNGNTLRWRNQKLDVTGTASFGAGGSIYIKNVNIQGGTLNGTSGTRQYEYCNTAASVSNFVQRFWDVVFPSSASVGDANVLRWNATTGIWDPVSIGVTSPFGQELFNYAVSETTGAIGSDGNLGTNINGTTRAFAFVPAGTVTITKMRTMITQVGGTYFRLGIYDASGNLVAKSARYSVSTGMKEVNLTVGPGGSAISNVTLTGGMVYYMAYWADDTTQNFQTPVLSGRSTSTASPLMQRTSGTNSEMADTIGSATNTQYRPWLMISG